MNVVLWMNDALRWDYIQHMPFVREWAKRCTVYTRAYTPAAWTWPAHLSILGGCSPYTHGFFNHPQAASPADHGNWPLDYRQFVRQPAQWLPEAFTEAHALTGGGFCHREFIGHGFDSFDSDSGTFVGKFEFKPVVSAIKALHSHENTFLFIQGYNTHEPLGLDNVKVTGREMDAEKEIRAAYMWEVERLDELMERVWQAVGRDAWENTVFVFTTDHGEELGDHGQFGHAMTLYEEIIRVPLIIWNPGMAPQEIDRVVNLAGLADHLCTLGGARTLPFPVTFADDHIVAATSHNRWGEPTPHIARQRYNAWHVHIHGTHKTYHLSHTRTGERLDITIDLSKDPSESGIGSVIHQEDTTWATTT